MRKSARVIAGRTLAEDMGDTEAQTVLARIAAAGRQEHKARAMTLQKALRVTMAKVAETQMDLPMALIGAVLLDVAGDAVEEALEDSSLLLLLDGPGMCAGAVMIDQVVAGGLIQQQTIGAVHPDAGKKRAMTRTDAALCAPLIDGLLERAAPILDDADERYLIEGFQFGTKAEDARTLAMSLDATDYRSIALTVDIAQGVRQGKITLILPTPESRRVALARDTEGEDEDMRVAPPDLTQAVMGLNADLLMVVCQLSMPFTALRDLKVGDTVALTPGAFPNVQITTRMGRVLGRGVVGHVDGVRAVRPLRPPSHAAQPLRRASDQPLVDMPEVEVLSATGRRMTLPRVPDVSDAELEVAMQDLPPIDAGMDATQSPPTLVAPSEVESRQSIGADVEFPVVEDMPMLDDLPDLEDLPDLAMQSAG